MKYFGQLIMVIALCCAGYGFYPSGGYESKHDAKLSREKIETLEGNIEIINMCLATVSKVNGAHDTEIMGLRRDLDAHKASTTDEFGRLRTTVLPENVRAEMREALIKIEGEEAARLRGGAPVMGYSSPSSPSYPPPMTAQVVIPSQPPQQPQRQKVLVWGRCGNCCRHHWILQ